MKKVLLLLFSVWMAIGALSAQSKPATPPPSPANHEFDFWLGDWEVFGTDGKKLGDSLVLPVAEGHGLLENWSPVTGGAGKALHCYDAPSKHWRQFWVGGSGVLELAGGFSEGSMRLAGTRTNEAGVTTDFEINWTPKTDGTVHQTMRTSTDGKATWKAAFDGTYRHKAKP